MSSSYLLRPDPMHVSSAVHREKNEDVTEQCQKSPVWSVMTVMIKNDCWIQIKVRDERAVWALWDVLQSAKCSVFGEQRDYSTTVWWDSVTGLSWPSCDPKTPKSIQFFLQWSDPSLLSQQETGLTWLKNKDSVKCNQREHGGPPQSRFYFSLHFCLYFFRLFWIGSGVKILCCPQQPQTCHLFPVHSLHNEMLLI